ncbi:MAG: VOC family protein [Longimicrobiales bacterium]
MATTNRSAPTATVVPVLVYDDVARAVSWLCAAFGFKERLRAADREGRVSHAQLAVAEGALMLGRKGGPFRPPDRGHVTQYVVVHVENVDTHHERATRLGAEIVSPPTNMPFGERQYTAEDPEGHRWTFSQHIADLAPEDWGATSAG